MIVSILTFFYAVGASTTTMAPVEWDDSDLSELVHLGSENDDFGMSQEAAQAASSELDWMVSGIFNSDDFWNFPEDPIDDMFMMLMQSSTTSTSPEPSSSVISPKRSRGRPSGKNATRKPYERRRKNVVAVVPTTTFSPIV
jgi:hypothetical protein